MRMQIPQFTHSWPSGEPVIAWWAHMQPVSWQRAGRSPRGHSYIPRDEVAYRDELHLRWTSAGHRFGGCLEGPLAVAMEFSGTTQSAEGRRHTRPDVSNLVKALEDAGNGWLWRDDGQIRKLAASIRRWDADAQPSIAVWVWQLEEWPVADEARLLEASK